MEMESVVTQFFNTLSFMAIYSLVGIGLAVMLSMMGVINLAHGEFLMLGAYAAWLSNQFVHNFWTAVVLAVIAVGVFSLIIERTVIRVLYQRPLDTILATWGVGIVIREVTRLVFGKSYKFIEVPVPGFVTFWGIEYSAYRLLIIVLTIGVLTAVFFFFHRTEYGLQARAIMANKEMSAALGINTTRVNQFIFGLGASLAALAGAILAPIYTAGPYMGLEWLVGAFFVVVIGGVSSVFGPMGGATVMGGARGATEYFLNPVLAQVIVLVIAIFVVRLRPRGLFAAS
jgi:urea ABC transporter permease protein UrtB